MTFRDTGFAVVACLMLSGCAAKPYASRAAVAIQRIFQDQNDSRLWREQKARQQRIAREAGRIGYIGNLGPALGTSVPSSFQ
jgi:outer membrane biogenesis lipoprotein LolB